LGFCGFLSVFLVMPITFTKYRPLPSGGSVVSCKLWKYYVIELRRAFGPYANAVELATGSSAVALTTFGKHFLCATAGGLILLGFRHGVQKIRCLRKQEPKMSKKSGNRMIL
jgi:hypothetical protein